MADGCFADMIDQCGGICVTQTLVKRDQVSNLYAGIGFNVAGVDEQDKRIATDFPYITLPAATSPVMKEFTWKDFKQDGTGNMNISGTEAAKSLAAIHFLMTGKNDSVGNFNIMFIGPYNRGVCYP